MFFIVTVVDWDVRDKLRVTRFLLEGYYRGEGYLFDMYKKAADPRLRKIPKILIAECLQLAIVSIFH